MLDVHPPEHAAHTWRDFYIHIATIVIGLLIAIGLEQSVEWLHRRHELRETREALHQEREENRKFFVVNTADFRLETAMLENDLQLFLTLQQHPGTPEEKLPGVPLWSFGYEPTISSVWKNAQLTQALALLPRQEAEDTDSLYWLLEREDAGANDTYSAIKSASAYAIVDPDPSHMTPAQVAAEIELIQKAIQADQIWAIYLTVIHRYYSDFSPAPDPTEVVRIAGLVRSSADQQKLAPAQAITDTKLATFRADRLAALKAAGDTH
jgi:type II secretory pathway pseudopilin PulG